MSGERDDAIEDAIAGGNGLSSDSSSRRPSGKRSGLSERRASREAAASSGQSTATLTRARPTASSPSKASDTARKRRNPITAVITFIAEVVAELRKVIWPSRKQMVTYTTVVLVFVAFMVAYIGGLDFGFVKGVTWLFTSK